jgi:hypothetical protein
MLSGWVKWASRVLPNPGIRLMRLDAAQAIPVFLLRSLSLPAGRLSNIFTPHEIQT